MAPVSDSNYFASLEECLSGERMLLSWKHVATALSDDSGRRQTSAAVVDFLADEYVHSLLKDPAAAFAPPSDSTRKDFETKTAPINVASASADKNDVKTVKEDAEWLSKNARVNLVAALRVAVVEFQSRASQHLTGPLSTQDATNLQEAAGLQNGQGGSLLADLGAAPALDSDEISAEFAKVDSRHRRLFDTLLTERRSFMMTMDYIYSIKLYGRLPIFTATRVTKLATLYKLKETTRAKEEATTLLPAYLKIVSGCMGAIESGLGSLTDDKAILAEAIELEWFRSLLTEIVHALSVVFQLVDHLGSDFPPSGSINQWFSLMDTYTFFDSIQPIHPKINELIPPLKSLAVAVSIGLLKPARSLTFLAEREEDPTLPEDSYDAYPLLSDVLEQVHKCIIDAASADCEAATPAIFAWTLLLHRMNVSYQNRTEKRDNLLQQNARENFESGGVIRPTGRRNSAGSIFSIESSKFDGFLENATASKDLQVVEQLASSVTAHGKVFDIMSSMATGLGPSVEGSMSPLLSSRIRAALLELLKVSYPIVGYQSEPLGTLLSVLSTGRDYWNLSSEDALSASHDVLTSMTHDDYLMQFYFQQALDRFPYEFMPFISLCKSLCTAATSDDEEQPDLILDLLRKTPSLTFVLPDDFQGYELVQEDENTNSFCILEDIPLITLSSSWKRRYIEDDAYRIPAGAYGRFITDTGRVVLMDFPHSTLSLLGRQLEINLMKEGYRSELNMLQPEEVVEVISLLATLLRMEYLRSTKTNSNTAVVQKDSDLLHEMSKHISGGRDIVTVVCETMDYFMQDELAMAEEAAVNVVTACVKFLDAIVPVQPSRVWSYLARSELLSSDSRAGKLAKITGTLDLVSERFNFLMSSLSFFSGLIDTAMHSAVQRRAGNKFTGRQKAESNPWLGTADKVLSRVSVSIAHASIDVFESSSTWRFESDVNRLSLLDAVVPVLDKLVLYSYNMGESASAENLTSCLRAAASYIVGCFMSPATGTLRFQPILSSLIAGFVAGNSTLYPTRTRTIRGQLTSTLKLSTTLLRAANYTEQSTAMFETYLFKSSTLLARICAVSDLLRSPAIVLLEALVVNAGKSASEPPSLLGYLGPEFSKSFLQLLSSLGRPLALTQDAQVTWRFFSSILRNRQQWMSNCLLTGQTPREAMKQGSKASELSADSVFADALAKLRALKDLDGTEALAILDFVASAQNYWPWTVFTLLKDTTYVDGLRAYVRKLKPSHLTVKTDAVGTSIDARIAAYVAETLAMQLYHSRHQGNADALAKALVTDLDYFLRDGVEVAGYNKSLHGNFAKNFANKYFGCAVENFKRTGLEPGELGNNYYYDLDRADDMLKFDPGWLGRRDNGFKNEMELANANLSLVDAQIALFHAWEFLLLELSTCLPANETVVRQMLQVAQQCLNANQSATGPESIFVKLVAARADLALVLVQRLVKSSIVVKDINQLLVTLVATIRGVEEPLAKESAAYYRTLLKCLFVTLRAYQLTDQKAASDSSAELESSAADVTQTILNILDHVVCKGFRALVSLIHDNDAEVVPEDLALLTAILQASLGLPTIEQSQTQVMNIVASHDAVHAATALFSWADKLAHQGDPVYGELSILFLLELSTLPLIAEQLACDGVLSSLLSANLAKYMLKAEISPYADAPVAQRCYAIWAKGLLPFMLNLLASLGATIAPEVAYVLNQFSHLLESSVDRFEAPGLNRTASRSRPHYVTLVATSEIHSLALLTRILAVLRINNTRDISAVEWDTTGLLENVDFWLSGRRLLRERLLPLGAREVEWRNTKASNAAGGNDNVLEQKVVSQLETVRDVLSEALES